MKLKDKFLNGAVSYWNKPMDMTPPFDISQMVDVRKPDDRSNRKIEKARSRRFERGKFR